MFACGVFAYTCVELMCVGFTRVLTRRVFIAAKHVCHPTRAMYHQTSVLQQEKHACSLIRADLIASAV